MTHIEVYQPLRRRVCKKCGVTKLCRPNKSGLCQHCFQKGRAGRKKKAENRKDWILAIGFKGN